MRQKRLVIGLGGNAIMNPSKGQELSKELNALSGVAASIANASKKFDIVLTHGNGPQVGDELLKNLNTRLEPLPLYLLTAETQASIGSMLEANINRFAKKKFVSLITHSVVSPNDKAFEEPSKPIGPFYTKSQISKLSSRTRLSYARFKEGFRLVVPSPEPKEIVEADAVKALLGKFNIICCGGGGIPVVKEGNRLKGVNAVIDKDLTTQVIATEISADKMVLLTNVDFVYADFSDKRSAIRQIKASELKPMLEKFEEGSIRPKALAAIRFVEQTKKRAYIGHYKRLEDILAGKSGTVVLPD